MYMWDPFSFCVCSVHCPWSVSINVLWCVYTHRIWSNAGAYFTFNRKPIHFMLTVWARFGRKLRHTEIRNVATSTITLTWHNWQANKLIEGKHKKNQKPTKAQNVDTAEYIYTNITRENQRCQESKRWILLCIWMKHAKLQFIHNQALGDTWNMVLGARTLYTYWNFLKVCFHSLEFYVILISNAFCESSE